MVFDYLALSQEPPCTVCLLWHFDGGAQVIEKYSLGDCIFIRNKYSPRRDAQFGIDSTWQS